MSTADKFSFYMARHVVVGLIPARELDKVVAYAWDREQANESPQVKATVEVINRLAAILKPILDGQTDAISKELDAIWRSDK